MQGRLSYTRFKLLTQTALTSASVTPLTLSPIAITDQSPIGADVGFFSGAGFGTITLTDDSSGRFEVSANRLRMLKKSAAGTYTIKAKRGSGQEFTFNIIVTQYIGILPESVTGLVARIRVDDPSRYTLDGSNKLQEVRAADGTVLLSQATSTLRPTISTTLQNGKAGIDLNGSTQMEGVLSALNTVMDASDQNYTIFLVARTSTANTNAKEAMGWGSSSRDWAIIRERSGGSGNWGILQGDDSLAINEIMAGSFTGVAPNTPVIWSARSNGTLVNIGYGAEIFQQVNATRDGAKTGPSAFRLGGRAVSPTTSNRFYGVLYDVLIYNTVLTDAQIEGVAANLRATWGISKIVTPTYLDLSNYTQTFADDFETFNVRPQALDFVPGSTGWRMNYATPAPLPNGSAIAYQTNEEQWYYDPRNPNPSAPAYSPFVHDPVKGEVRIIGDKTPTALKPYVGGAPFASNQNYVSGTLTTAQWFQQQYGYFEIRCKLPPALANLWPAAWLLYSGHRWPPEIDIMERFGTDSRWATTLHMQTLFGVGKADYGNSAALAGIEDWGLLGCDWQADGIKFYFNHELVWTFPGMNSLYKVNITAGGSGYALPTLTFSGGGSGTGAAGTASVAAGGVSGLSPSGGTGYGVVSFAGGGSGATAQISVDPSGALSPFTLSDGSTSQPVKLVSGGSGYPNSGTWTVTGGTAGTQASGTYTAVGGVIQTVTVTTPGSGYLTVALSGGRTGGVAASFGTLLSTTGALVGFNKASAGSGYLQATLSGGSPYKAGSIGTPVISGGAIQSIPLASIGAGYTTTPTITISGGGGTGATATITLTGETNGEIPRDFHTPMYLILNLAMGGFMGAMGPANTPAYFDIDYVKVWKKNIPTPTILTGTQSETTALLSAFSSAGYTPTAPHQTAINDFIRQAKSWKLRLDTTAMGGDYSYDVVNGLTLWQALDYLQIGWTPNNAAKLISWKNPAVVGTINGTVTSSANGLIFPGAAGAYVDTGMAFSSMTQFRQTDMHIGAWLETAITGATPLTFMGGSNTRLSDCADSHSYLLCGGSNSGSVVQKPIGAAHVMAGRTFNFVTQSFRNGGLHHEGFISGGTNSAPTGNLLLGSYSSGVAGAPVTIGASHAGRFMPPDENAKLFELLTQLRTALTS